MRSRRPSIVIEPALLILLSLAVLIVPIQWLAAWIAAAVVHELGHVMAIHIFGLEINRINIGLRGTTMYTGFFSNHREIICAFAGPAVSILLIFVRQWFPRLAICGTIQAAYNLIPLYPLDGGRVMRGLVKWALPVKWWVSTIRGVEWTFIFFLGFFAIWCAWKLAMGVLPVVLYIFLLSQNMKVKFPCKQGREGVQ